MNPISLKTLGTLVPMLCMASTSNALPIIGQGAWENSLHGKDQNNNATTSIEAFFATNGLKNGNINNTINTASLTAGSFTDWHLPSLSPIDSTLSLSGSDIFNTSLSSSRNNTGSPVSKKRHLFYPTLGNLSACLPYESDSSANCSKQLGFGLNNASEFTGFLSRNYWSSVELDPSSTWYFDFDNDLRDYNDTNDSPFALSDDTAVPAPAAAWLMGSLLLGLAGFERKRR